MESEERIMAIRQFKSLIAAGLAVLLVGSSAVPAGWQHVPPSYQSPHGGKRADQRETVCENLKLDAAAHYFQCLVGACRVANTRGDEPSESTIANCDAHFRRAFEQAEARGGGGAGNVDPANSADNTMCITGGGGGGASLAVASTATCSGHPRRSRPTRTAARALPGLCSISAGASSR
jgi:hypothetical protein